MFFASTWENADTINGVVTGNVATGNIGSESHKLGVDVGWETKTLEVSVEVNWVVFVELVEEFA